MAVESVNDYWSPYRGWILYAYRDGVKREIHLYNPKTYEIEQLTVNNYMDESPSISAYSSMVVYSSYRNPLGWELYVLDLNTIKESKIT